MPKPAAEDTDLTGRLSRLSKGLGQNQGSACKELPGLDTLLTDWLEPEVEVNKLDVSRRLLRVFRDSPDNTYQDLLGKHSPDERTRVERFVDGGTPHDCGKGFEMLPNLGTREEVEELLKAPLVKSFSGVPTSDSGWCLPITTILARLFSFAWKDEKRPALRMHKNAGFQNWGRTVKYTSSYTCVPTTVEAVKQIVLFAKKKEMSVRCAAYRHSWAPIFGREGQITISTLRLGDATKLPNTAALPLPQDPPTELESIEFTSDPPLPGGKRLVRIGAATTNERLRRWCLDKKLVTLPLNVIMVETTLGGSTSATCHGSGKRHPTISDLVRRIEYVDASGTLREIREDNPEFLKAAAGCFGLLGVVTHITSVFDPMVYAVMRPIKLPVIETIPLPPELLESQIPVALRPNTPLSVADKARIKLEFERRANNDYYAEWFWCPYDDECWINTWNTDKDDTDVKGYPDDAAIFLAFVETFALNVMQSAPVLEKLVEWTDMTEAVVTLISFFSMLNFPEVKSGEEPIKTYLPDALHYQRAIQNVRVRNMEVQIPLTPKRDKPGEVDYTNVQRAWWDAILKAYEHSDTCPQRMPLEMRIMGGSDITMAAQHGNTLGTCSIGILTLESAADIWEPYAQDVLDKWMSYEDGGGRKLKTSHIGPRNGRSLSPNEVLTGADNKPQGRFQSRWAAVGTEIEERGLQGRDLDLQAHSVRDRKQARMDAC